MSGICSVNIVATDHPTKWVFIIFYWTQFKWIINEYQLQISVQQRYVVAVMMFLALGVTFSLRISFSIILTQMVYIPNANENNKTTESNGELICPVKYEFTSSNEIHSPVCNKFVSFKNIVSLSTVIFILIFSFFFTE